MKFLKNKALPCTLNKPCQNGATCTNDNVGGYKCTCATGYTGTNCEYGMRSKIKYMWSLIFFIFFSKFILILNDPENEALPCTLKKPCQNGATCTDDDAGGYTCACVTGYTGTNCQYGMPKLKFINTDNNFACVVLCFHPRYLLIRISA